MAQTLIRTFLLLVATAALSCRSPADDPSSTVPGQCQINAPLIAPQKTDILFVIDNSNSMKEEQDSIAQELPAFIESLKAGGGVAQDFQVGMITTSVYGNYRINGTLYPTVYHADQSGKLQAAPLVDPAGNKVPGYERILRGDDPELVAKFRRLVTIGTGGSAQETPFEAVRLALSEPLISTPADQGGNQGFLRDGSRLLVVVVTDEDDCSESDRPPEVVVGNDPSVNDCRLAEAELNPTSEYFDFLRGLKDGTGAPREVLWASIAPVSRSTKEAQEVLESGQVKNADCPTSYQPGYRHHEMAKLFDPSLANLDSICRASYRETLISIAGIATTNQSLEISNIPDPRLMKIELSRKDGEVQACTVANGGITYLEATADRPGRVYFQEGCKRRADDQSLLVKLICAG